MTHYLRRVLCVLLCLPAWALASEPSQFTAALRETTVGGNAAQAFFLVGLLRDTGAPRADIEALRRELLHAYVAQITSPAVAPPPRPGAWESLKRRLPGAAPAPKDTVAAAIARGRTRPDVLDAPFRAAWQGALNQGLVPRWETGAARAPFFTIERRDMQPVAPGLWAAPAAGGRVRLMLALRLANTSTQPLPIFRPDIILGGAPGTGLDGLAFACTWDRPDQNLSEMQANAVVMVQPGEASGPLACEAQPAPMYWRDQLAAALMTAGAVANPLLVPHDMDNARRLYHLELALRNLAPQDENWGRRRLVAQQEPARQWAPGANPLEPPESSPWAARPHQGWKTSAEALKYFLGGTVLALALFAGGRGLIRVGVPKVAVGVVTLLAGAGLAVLATASLDGGTGYGHPLYAGIALLGIFGPVLLCVLALHGLQVLLDDEGIDWWDAVAKGWRSALDLTSATSRAEFWCFLAHCAWLWALARICFAPLDRWLGLALMVPLLTLTVRRLRSMTSTEMLGLGLSAACLVLLVLV